MLSFSIPYPNVIKISYFADPIQGGDSEWKEAQKEGENKVILKKTLLTMSRIASSSCSQQINILRAKSSL